MELTDEMKCFVKAHANDDVVSLLFRKDKYPRIDMTFAVEQILCRRYIKGKIPSWYGNEDLMFPSKISVEQASSEVTARYKQRLIPEGCTLCDLTGGLGVDSFFFSRRAARVIYIERYPGYCQSARLNFPVLGADNIEVIEGNVREVLPATDNPDVYYIDPARRGAGNRRVFALEDCEPDLVQLRGELLSRAPRLIAKLSPMEDIRHTLSLLPETVEVHILSVRNECKELLFVMERDAKVENPPIYCVNFTTEGEEENFRFTLDEEQDAVAPAAPKIGSWFYEPNASILKAGAFKCIAGRSEVQKLHVSSHLYTSEEEVREFPGRRFVVEEVIPFTGKTIGQLSATFRQANITVRNFPLSVQELRARTKIKEGGDVYLFATTWGEDEKVLVKCRKAGAVSEVDV